MLVFQIVLVNNAPELIETAHTGRRPSPHTPAADSDRPLWLMYVSSIPVCGWALCTIVFSPRNESDTTTVPAVPPDWSCTPSGRLMTLSSVAYAVQVMP